MIEQWLTDEEIAACEGSSIQDHNAMLYDTAVQPYLDMTVKVCYRMIIYYFLSFPFLSFPYLLTYLLTYLLGRAGSITKAKTTAEDYTSPTRA